MRTFHHISKISLASIWCLLVVFLASEQPVFAGDSDHHLTIGIVPVDDVPVVHKVADLAYPVFQRKSGVSLVERSELERVQEELVLATAMASPAGRLQLGKIIGADFLVMIEAANEKDDEDNVWLRIVDCATGCVAASIMLPTKNNRELTELLNESVAVFYKKMRWLAAVSRSELIPISIPALNCLAPGSLSDEQAGERLRRQLLARLGSLPGVVCLERDELLRAKREMVEFKGDVAEFWSSAVIVTGAAGLQGEGLRELFASLTLHFGNGLTIQLAPVVGDTREFDELVQRLMTRIQEKLPNIKPDEDSNGFDVKSEIVLLTRLGSIYQLGGQYEKAQTVLENALALQPGEPTQEQRIQMAEVLQRLQPGEGLSDHPPKDVEEYVAQLERYIYMIETYVQPWRYQYRGKRVIRRDISRFLVVPPGQIKHIIRSRKKNPSYEGAKEIVNVPQRMIYLGTLIRQCAELEQVNANPMVFSDDPKVVVDWYRDAHKERLEQAMKKWTQEKVDSATESERTRFVGSIVSRMRNFSAFKSSKYYTLPFPNAASVIDELHQINRDVFDRLSTHLSLSEAAKAFVLIKNTNLWTHLVSRPSRGGLATTPEEFIQALRTLADMLDNHRENGESYWIISEALSTKDYYNDVSCILWAMVHLLPQNRREALMENWFIPKMTENPASSLVAPLYSLMPTRRRLRDFVPGKHMDMPKHHELFRHPDTNDPCFDLYACAELRDYFASNQDTPGEESEFSIPLLEFYLTHRDEVKLDAQGERILAETLALANKHSPRAAAMIARIEREKSSAQDKPPAVDGSCLVLDQSIKTGKSLRFDEYDAPIDAVVHGNRLWMLWGGSDGFAFLELDLNSLAAVRAVPLGMSRPGTGKYMAPHRMYNLNSVQWARTNKHLFIGHRDFILMEPSQIGVAPFATGSVPANIAGLDISAVKSLSTCVQSATPKGNASGRLPVPREAGKGITAFCGIDDRVYFANLDGIYCWNESENTLELVASCHMTNSKSPLDGGMPYYVYWMGVDSPQNRVVLAVHESQNGNSRIWGDMYGNRTGIWTYDPQRNNWQHLIKMALDSRTIPDSLIMRTQEEGVVFNSSQVSGIVPFISPDSLFHRSSCGWKIGTHDPDTQKWWQVHKPLPPPAFLKTEGMAEHEVIVHPYDDAWIFHQPLGDSNRKVVYAKGRDAKEFEVLELRSLESAKYHGNFIHAFKVFPVPDGLVVWHLGKNENRELVHKLVRWTPNTISPAGPNQEGANE